MPAHPGNDYYEFPATGSIQRQANPILAEGLLAAGWNGPFTFAQAQALAQEGLQQQLNNAGSPTGGSVVSGALGIPNPLTGVNAIGDLAQRLTQKSTWVRVGEFVAGGIMIYVGLKAFFPSVVSAATAPVKKAAKASVFL
jgi:hypothetical protein